MESSSIAPSGARGAADRATRARFPRGPALLLYAFAAGVIALSCAASALTGLPVEVLLRDPVQTLGGHPLTGMQSYLGVVVWFAAAGVCLFSAALLRREGAGRERRAFLAASGALTALLAADDLFLLHEVVAGWVLRVDETLVFGAYFLAIGAYLLAFRATIRETPYGLLAAALGFFALSLAVDAVQHLWASPWRIVAEDGAKWTGIVSWSGYMVGACLRLTSGHARAAAPGAA